mmetsp:Transcript_9429/g.18562  ORF Transcript_9429/g.18562 Transcript_9429/m.18562 type:complete len:361 (-) Transcript_9429:57-1139(-)
MGASGSKHVQTQDDLYGSINCVEEVRDGVFHRTWKTTTSPPKALCFVFHGVHEHSGRYAELAAGFTARGVEVHALDHAGHGKSPSYATAPGDVGAAGWKGLVAAAVALVRETVQGGKNWENKLPPIIIFGHSLGSLVAFHVADELCQNPTVSPSPLVIVPSTVVLMGFPTRPGPSAAAPFNLECCNCIPLHCGNFARVVGGCMEVLGPKLPNSPVNVNHLTHDEERLAIVQRDAFHYKGDIQNRTGNQALRAVKAATDACARGDWGQVRDGKEVITQPGAKSTQPLSFRLLIVHGELDTLAYPTGSQRLLAAVGGGRSDAAASGERVKMIIYPGLYHELLQETPDERGKVAGDIYSFCKL